MKLIADSGSTNTSWALLKHDGSTEYFRSDGINPFFITSEKIYSGLSNSILPKLDGNISEIVFYGAGVTGPNKGLIVENALKRLFPEVQISIYDDLLAVAHATCGKEEGIACILGTGSNSGLYDGEKIVQQVAPLGFILGDEASGAVLGRKILGDYLKNMIPECLKKKFQQKFNPVYAEIMERVYRTEMANAYMAGFVPFIHENIDHEYCFNLVKNELRSFVTRNIAQYQGYKELKVHFVGSVGFYFQDILKSVLEDIHLKCGNIVRDPMDGLVLFHKY